MHAHPYVCVMYMYICVYLHVHASMFTCCIFGDCVFVHAVTLQAPFIRSSFTEMRDVRDHKDTQIVMVIVLM